MSIKKYKLIKIATKFFVCAFALIGTCQLAIAKDVAQNFLDETKAAGQIHNCSVARNYVDAASGEDRRKAMQKLDLLRAEIEKIDAELIQKIAARMAIVKQIGQAKKEAGIAVLDPAREVKLLRQYQLYAQENQLDPIFIQHLFEMIFSYSRELQ